MSDLIYSLGFPYGAPELVRNYRRHLSGGFVFAIALAFALIGIYHLMLKDERGGCGGVPFERLIDLQPPPLLPPFRPSAPPQPISPAPPVVEPKDAIPTPVADDKVDTNQANAMQKKGSAIADSSGEATGTRAAAGNGFGNSTGEIKPDEEPPAFLKVEIEPQLVKKVKPVYPELARRAGLEGVVWLKIWIDQQGRPKKIVVLQSDSEVFDQAAVAAAGQFVFTPAMMQNGPVEVWVTLPFRFTLR